MDYQAGGDVEYVATDERLSDSDVAELIPLERHAGGQRRPAQQRLEPRQQLDRLERLGQIVVGPELEADDAIDDLALGGEHQDRGLHPALA